METIQFKLRPTRALITIAERQLKKRLCEEFDAPLVIEEKGDEMRVRINEMSFAALLAEALLITRDPKFGVFYYYDDKTGTWAVLSEDRLKVFIDDLLRKLAKEAGLTESNNVTICSNRNYKEIIALLRGRTEFQVDPFEKRPLIIHAANCVLRWDGKGFRETELHPSYYSRSHCPIPFRFGAKCPRFHEFLASTLPLAEDRSLMQLIAGQWLIGKNLTQRIVIFKGAAGSGKSTLMNIFREVIGRHNVTELRTRHLSGRFEISAFAAKNLLIGADVPPDFLRNEGAECLKKLTGDDLILAERKYGAETREITGNFNAGLTLNGELVIAFNEDADAWARRLLVFDFRFKPKEVVADLPRLLVESEGEGILCWMVEGAARLLRLCDAHEKLPLTAEQSRRVTDVIARSNSLEGFLKTSVMAGVGDVTTSELLSHYNEYCASRGWIPLQDAERHIRGKIEAMFGKAQSHDIKREGRYLRGYRNIKIINHSTT